MKYEFKKPNKRQVKQILFCTLIIVLGNAIAAAASAFFFVPLNLSMGGTTGLAIFIGHFWKNDFAVSILVYILNFTLFVIGAILLGKKFAVATFAGTLLYPTFLSLWTIVNKAYVNANGGPITSDPLFASICGAVIFGFGIGIVMRVGASTGGTDIPALILHKFFGFSVGACLWAIDFTIILVQLTVVSVEAVLRGILLALLSSFIIDRVSPIGKKKVQVKIISKKYREIRDMILNKLNRGVTMLYGKTGFLQDKCYVLMAVVSNRDVIRLKNEILKIDPEAFIMVSEIAEVSGRGFSKDKIVLPRSEEKEDSDEESPD